jgi:transcriptional regulator with XRE-family HTH domain
MIQERLAELARCSVKTIQKLESGGNVSLRTLSDVATALGVTVDKLLVEETFVVGKQGIIEDKNPSAAPCEEVIPKPAPSSAASCLVGAELTITRNPDQFTDHERKLFFKLLGSVLVLGNGQEVVVTLRRVELNDRPDEVPRGE